MSARYGSRTRSGEAVSDLGRRATAGGGGGGDATLTEDVFTAPGTWTCPPSVTWVEVVVVGGGGGGQYGEQAPTYVYGGSGGGGGVRFAVVPVSGPVPVTVGAGGTGGTEGPNPAFPAPATSATAGGTSGFGPLGPGPIPSIPPTTIAAGGGAQGGQFAPSIGGGAGGLIGATSAYYGGQYGFPTIGTLNSPQAFTSAGAGAGGSNIGEAGGIGMLGYGFGAPSAGPIVQWPGYGSSGAGTPSFAHPSGGANLAIAGTANTGGGGGGAYSGALYPILGPQANPVNTSYALFNGAPGGSGIVIVRSWT